jgi:glycosyltransferase involved in cell wall biosynthesis
VLRPWRFRPTAQTGPEDGIAGRVRITGPLTRTTLGAAYAGGDLLALASRTESYGMVVTEALARGLPVVATSVGGESGGAPPGLLVPPDALAALAEALSAWLDDGELRRRLRQAAEQRRETLFGWSATADRMSSVLAELV